MNKKVRLHNDDFELSGYENLKILSIEDLEKLKIFDKGELDELIIEHVIDYLPVDKTEDILEELTQLVRKHGRVVVVGTDLYEICKNFSNYNINIREANRAIFGESALLSKKVVFTTVHMSNFLSEVCKLKVLKKRVNVFVYSIEAERI